MEKERINLDSGVFVDHQLSTKYFALAVRPELTFTPNKSFSFSIWFTPTYADYVDIIISITALDGKAIFLGYQPSSYFLNISGAIFNAGSDAVVGKLMKYDFVWDAADGQYRIYANSILLWTHTVSWTGVYGDVPTTVGKYTNPTGLRYDSTGICSKLVFFNTAIDKIDGVVSTKYIEVMNGNGNWIPTNLHANVVEHLTCQEKYGDKLYSCVKDYNYAKEVLPFYDGDFIGTGAWAQFIAGGWSVSSGKAIYSMIPANASILSLNLGLLTGHKYKITYVVESINGTTSLEIYIGGQKPPEGITVTAPGTYTETLTCLPSGNGYLYFYTIGDGLTLDSYTIEPISHGTLVNNHVTVQGYTDTNTTRKGLISKAPLFKGVMGNGINSSITFPDSTNAALVGKTDVLYYFDWYANTTPTGDFLLSSDVDGNSVSLRIAGGNIGINGITSTNACKNFKLLNQDLTDATIKFGRRNRLIVHYKQNQVLNAYLNGVLLSTSVKDTGGTLVPALTFNYTFAGTGAFVLMNVLSGNNSPGAASNATLYEVAILNASTLTATQKVAITNGEYDPWNLLTSGARLFHIRPNQVDTESFAPIVELSPNAKTGWFVNFSNDNWSDGRTGLPEIKKAISIDGGGITVNVPKTGVSSFINGDTFSIVLAGWYKQQSNFDLRMFTWQDASGTVVDCRINRGRVIIYMGGTSNYFTANLENVDRFVHIVISKIGYKHLQVVANGKRLKLEAVGMSGSDDGNYLSMVSYPDITFEDTDYIQLNSQPNSYTFLAAIKKSALTVREAMELYSNGLFKNPSSLASWARYYQTGDIDANGYAADLTGRGAAIYSGWSGAYLDPEHPWYEASNFKTINELR